MQTTNRATQRAAGRKMNCLQAEYEACNRSFTYWLDRYGTLYDATARGWTRFHLWPSQAEVADSLARERLVIILKARQLGMTWLVVGRALWLMLFRPAATVLLFSQRDDEAVHLLGFRLAGMYERLPAWQHVRSVVVRNAHEFRLSNGSAALAFPTTGGRSYTATLAIVDEADHVGGSAGGDSLDALLDAVKPTVDGGGSLVLLSTVDKDRPQSAFKRIYRAARQGESGWHAIFLPWSARPARDAAWYAAQQADILVRTGTLDSLYQEYPANDVEALAGRTRDRRFAAEWLARADDTGSWKPVTGSWKPEAGNSSCSRKASVGEMEQRPASSFQLPASSIQLPATGLSVWEEPQEGRWYVIGADPAEGNPRSDESAACVLDAATGDQVAVLAGQFEPAVFAAYLAALRQWYGAGLLVERNNHGHAVLLWLAEHGEGDVLRGRDGRPGWLSSGQGKPLAYDAAAEVLRDGCPHIRDRETLRQLMEVRGTTLAAGSGDHDDRATAWVLAQAAARYCAPVEAIASVILPPERVADERETAGW